MMGHFLNSWSHYNGEEGNQPSRESSSSTPPLLGHHNEVFLSFRGETRKGFTDHLYKRLCNAGIVVFRDKEGLPVGERNGPELLKAIEASKISIPIISSDYASSEWCLNELVHILKCKKTFGQHVIPIFYQVRPSYVRSLDISNEESQVCKKRRHNPDDTHAQEWKDALMEVSYMTGLESEKVANGYEGELVETVVAEVLKALKKHTLAVSNHLVGVEDHVEKIMNMVNVEGSNDVRAILIHGMGGMGKTTLAKVLYNQLADQFDCCSFLANIRETWSHHKGKEELQAQLISDIIGQKQSISSVDKGVDIIENRFKHKKSLILLDDVDHRDQLETLARKPDWFGRGSMLIITSRINDIVEKWEGSVSYELNRLKDDQSYLLFCKHAFKKIHSIPNEFHTIAKQIVSTTGGLPLAIEVIGCLLYNKDQHFWELKLKELREIPEDAVQRKLKISFDALKPEEKIIFLDIACHLGIREKKEYARYMWDSYDFYSELKIRKLISLSLIKIVKGEETLEEELIIHIHDQLRDLGREIVRQECIDNPGKRSRLWKEEEAQEILQLEQGTEEIQTMESSLEGGKPACSKQFKRMTKLRYLYMWRMNLEGDFENLFQNLRWLEWYFGRLDFMRSNFIPKKLVVLELYDVNIIEQWTGWSQMKDLRVLKLHCCDQLITLPDISELKRLEVLSLWYCINLRDIQGLDNAKGIKSVEIISCYSLERIGDLSNLKMLTKLELFNCNKLLEIRGMGISVTDLELVGLNSLVSLPDLSTTKKLKELRICNCTKPLEIRGIGISLTRLELEGLDSLVSLPNISTTKKLKVLRIRNCINLIEIQGLDNVDGIEIVVIDGCSSLERIGDLSNLKMLIQLELCNCKKLLEIRGLAISVVYLELEGLDSLVSLPNISTAKKLKELRICNCTNLIEIQGLDNVDGIKSVVIHGCSSLERIGNLSNLKILTKLDLYDCKKLSDIQGIENLTSLTSLSIIGCPLEIKFLDFPMLDNQDVRVVAEPHEEQQE